MATTNAMSDAGTAFSLNDNGLLVLLPALPRPQLDTLLENLAGTLPAEKLLIATPEEFPAEFHPDFRFAALPSAQVSWMLTAADFVNARELAQRCNARSILLLGPRSESLTPAGIRELAGAVMSAPADLAVPRYTLRSREALVNSAILYPLSRALFATRARFPMSPDLGLSPPMVDRMALAARRLMGMNQSDVPLWAVNEAMVAGMMVEEVDVGERALAQPAEPDLNNLLPLVVGSLFSDIENKAAYWQRARVTPPARRPPLAFSDPPQADASQEIASMVHGFRLACTNLQEIWGLILPPNTLVGLKRLSTVDGPAFRMPENLWVRIVYDFLVAYRQRSLNRGHLLGALIPLYRAWVAGHMNIMASGSDPERHIEALAQAFEADKAYLVARWRWPDRFNP